MRKHIWTLVGMLVLASLILSACATPATGTPVVEQVTVEVPREATVIVTAPPAATATPVPPLDLTDRVAVRWFVGLGTGTNPPQIETQNQVVEQFNASQTAIYLQLEIVPNNSAYQILKTEIAAGNAPDIVGPVGVRGANGFKGLWLDLTPYIEENNVDLSVYDPALVEFWKITGEGQVGLPFAVFPSFLYYNVDLFQEAGLPEPPHEFGEQYDGAEWDIDALTELAKKLTVDTNGNDATSADFDRDNIVQYGFVHQWTDARGQATLFGPASFVADDFETAQIPDNWRAAFNWLYDGIWGDQPFYPSDTVIASDLLGAGNPFNSGNVALASTHLWFTCCQRDVANWNIAVVPSYNGETTAKLHADTIRILASTQHPDEAFTVLTYLLGEAAPDLLLAYGGLPANQTQQADFFASLDETFAPLTIDWQVAIDSLAYPDNPNHESDMPNFLKADDRVKAFGALFGSTPDLDIDAELDKLQSDLQAIFSEPAQ